MPLLNPMKIKDGVVNIPNSVSKSKFPVNFIEKCVIMTVYAWRSLTEHSTIL